MISSQDICDNLQKQETRDVLWNHGVGEINHGVGNIFPQAPSYYRTPSDPDRSFQPVRGRHTPPVNVGSELSWHPVWYVFVLIPTICIKRQGLLIVGSA